MTILLCKKPISTYTGIPLDSVIVHIRSRYNSLKTKRQFVL